MRTSTSHSYGRYPELYLRQGVLGIIAGFIVGALGTFACGRFFDASGQTAALQVQLNDLHAKLAATAKDRQETARETSSAKDQNRQLLTENDDLQNQIDALKASLSIAQSRTITTTALRDSVNEMNSRSSSMSPWHLYLLKTRLDLTPEQEANFQAAASGGDAGREIGQKLESLLTPGQLLTYRQIQAQEKDNNAQSAASVRVNTLAPMLQLSDAQKDAAMNAIYQAQISPASQSNGAKALETEAAFTHSLTPEQLSVYRQLRPGVK